MGDMGEIFNAGKEIKAMARVDRNAEANLRKAEITKLVETITVDENGTWNLKLAGKGFQYYPTKGTWQWKGKMFRGGIHSFENWVKKMVES